MQGQRQAVRVIMAARSMAVSVDTTVPVSTLALCAGSLSNAKAREREELMALPEEVAVE